MAACGEVTVASLWAHDADLDAKIREQEHQVLGSSVSGLAAGPGGQQGATHTLPASLPGGSSFPP